MIGAKRARPDSERVLHERALMSAALRRHGFAELPPWPPAAPAPAAAAAPAAAPAPPPSQAQAQAQDDETQLASCRAQVVRTALYRGTVRAGEAVTLQRDAGNTHDPNAVRVLNAMGRHVGHLPKNTAAVLAPILDLGAEPEVTAPAASEGSAPLTVQVTLFGPLRLATPAAAAATACEHLFGGPAQLPRAHTAPPPRQQRAPAPAPPPRPQLATPDQSCQCAAFLARGWCAHTLRRLQEARAAAALARKRERAQLYQRRPKDELKRVLQSKGDALFQNAQDAAALPLAAQPAEIPTPLFPHQLQALGWMRQREEPRTVADALRERGGAESVLFWERVPGTPDDYRNVLSRYQQTGAPLLPRAGVLADEMGLGKTLSTIALIASSPAAAGQTLVVSPLSVLSVWTRELARHAPGVSAVTFHGPQRGDVDLSAARVVLTTYDVVAREWGKHGQQSKLHRRQWHRAVLDEAHCIKNPAANRHKAAVALAADVRWCLTATPIQNELADAQALLAFMHVAPFSDKKLWSQFVRRPLERGDPGATERLQVLLSWFTLRRCKDSKAADGVTPLVALPEKRVHELRVALDEGERARYEELYRACQSAMTATADTDDTLMRNYHRVLVALLRLRQLCLHPELVARREAESIASNLADALQGAVPADKLAQLRALLADDSFECSICLSSAPATPVATPCAHPFCRDCIVEWLAAAGSCPICRQPADAEGLTLIDASATEGEAGAGEGDDERDFSRPGSKLRAVIARMLEFPADTRCVVFSQFTTYLDVVQRHLAAAGFSSARLDGSVSARRREECIEQFQAPDGPRVMVASLKAAGVGITLTAATRVFILDPWWNAAVEEQAVDRIHRLGQRQPVDVYKVIADGTIEERILRKQRRKKTLASISMARASSGATESKASKREIRLQAVRGLFGVSGSGSGSDSD